MRWWKTIHPIRRQTTLLAAGAAFCSLAAAPALNGDVDVRRDAVVEAVQKVMPSVVNVATEEVVQYRDLFSPFFDQYFQHYGPQKEKSIGSGVIIDEDGYLLTNQHVVQRATRIQVKLSDEAGGKVYDVERVSSDPTRDLALLRIIAPKGEKFKAINLAKDGDLLLGETVIALGNPFGLGGSVSRGILSAKSRVTPKENETLDIENWLQTDASINPGNSGGPLVNLRGELIGVNVAMLEQGKGIGFAIPIQQVREAVNALTAPELSERWFGALVRFDTPPLTLVKVQPNTPADMAGLKVGDVITQLDGQSPKDAMQLSHWLSEGTKSNFVFTVQRGEQSKTLTVRLVPFSEFPNLLRRWTGLELKPVLDNFGRPTDAGLEMVTVETNGPAADAGLRPGVVLAGIDGSRVVRMLDAVSLLAQKKKGETAELNVVFAEQRGAFVFTRQGTAQVKVR